MEESNAREDWFHWEESNMETDWATYWEETYRSKMDI